MTRLKALVSNPVERVVDPDLPYVALEHIASGTGGLLEGVQLEGKVADDSVEHRPGDVRFGKLRPYLAKSFLATETGVGSGELLVLRPGREIHPRFLWYLTLSRPFVEWAVATSYGVKMPRTSWEALGQFDVELPSMKEQRQIVEYLDTETARIDELLREEEQLLSLTNEHLVATLQSDLWLQDAPHARLRSLLDPQRTLTYGVVLAGDHVEDGVPLVEARTIRGGKLDPTEVKRTSPEVESAYARSRVRSGDVLMAIRGSVGRTAVAPPWAESWNMSRDVALLPPDTGRVEPEWLHLLLSCPRAQSLIALATGGSAVKGINLSSLGKMLLPVPDLDTQRRALRRVGPLRDHMSAISQEVGHQAALLREHRQALITSAVTGGLQAVGRVA